MNNPTPTGSRTKLCLLGDYDKNCPHCDSTPTVEPWWYEQTADGDWSIGSGNRGFAYVDEEGTAKAIRDAHNAAIKSAYEKGYEDGKQAR